MRILIAVVYRRSVKYGKPQVRLLLGTAWNTAAHFVVLGLEQRGGYTMHRMSCGKSIPFATYAQSWGAVIQVALL